MYVYMEKRVLCVRVTTLNRTPEPPKLSFDVYKFLMIITTYYVGYFMYMLLLLDVHKYILCTGTTRIYT